MRMANISRRKCGRCGKGTLRRKKAIGSKLVMVECDSCGSVFVREIGAANKIPVQVALVDVKLI